MRIAVAYIERVMKWPTMRVDDTNALQSFSIFLRDCCNVMEDLQHMEEMNVPSNLRLLMMVAIQTEGKMEVCRLRPTGAPWLQSNVPRLCGLH